MGRWVRWVRWEGGKTDRWVSGLARAVSVVTGWFGCADGRVGEESLSVIVREFGRVGGWSVAWVGGDP